MRKCIDCAFFLQGDTGGGECALNPPQWIAWQKMELDGERLVPVWHGEFCRPRVANSDVCQFWREHVSDDEGGPSELA